MTRYSHIFARGARTRGAQIAFAALVAIAGCGTSDVGERVGTNAAAVVLPGTVSLNGSNFEIDPDANLTVQNAGALDWGAATVNETRKADTASGPNDESFGQGTKEDTAVPTVVTGGIPPNKSDLKVFGIYQEGDTISGFLNMFWTRVQEPSGTTNMDFELNKRQCTPNQTPADPDCTSNGLTPIRSSGDLLITYDLSQGGTNPILSLRTWNGSAWGAATDLTTSGTATGSINTTPIAAANSDGLGALSARTFGEAQIAMSALFNPNTCESFGSVYLKSRSSDSFTAALKDFVPPQAVNITNCGAVNIHKQDNTGAALAGAVFTLFTDNAPLDGSPPHGVEDISTSFTCTTLANGNCSIANVPFGQYWVVETTAPAGFQKADDQNVNLTSAVSTVNLTFTDNANPGNISIHKQDDTGNSLQGAVFTLFTDVEPLNGQPPHSGGDAPVVPSKTCTTDASGNCTIPNVAPGQYWIVETTTPAGYSTAPDQNRTITAGQTVNLTFSDPRKFHTIVIVCQDASGNGSGPPVLHSSSVTVDGVLKTSIATSGTLDQTTLCNLGGARYDDAHLGSNYTTLNVSISP